MKLVILFIFLLWIFYKICKSVSREGYTPEKDDVYISLTTSPKRIPHIEHLLQKLSNQTIKPKKIILNLPHVFKRDNSTFEKIPEFIKNYPLVQINRVEDLGPSTKILGALSVVTNPNDVIISVDDDIEYNDNMIETLLNYSKKNPDAIITGESFMRLKGNKAQLLEGYSGVLYKRDFFRDISFDKIKNYPRYCNLADDFILSNFMIKKNISIIVADDPENKTIKNAFLDYGGQEDALRNGAGSGIHNGNGNWENYQKCSKYLKENGELFIDYYMKEMYSFLF